jgi:hypothetical protein
MNTGLHRIGLNRLATSGGPFQGWPEKSAVKHSRPGSFRIGYFRAGVFGLLAILTAGAVFTLANWSPQSGRGDNTAGSGKIRLITASAPAPASAVAVSTVSTPDDASLYPDTAPLQAAAQNTVVTDGLSISSQYWRRGGLGSNALVTFTLRNGNDYAIRDIEISCAFSRRDGSHLTDRTRIIHDTVRMKGRKSFAHVHVGFVNVNADRAKCTPVSASRI